MNNMFLKVYGALMTLVAVFLAIVAWNCSQPVKCDEVEWNQAKMVNECILELGDRVPVGTLDVQKACLSGGLDCDGLTFLKREKGE